MKTPRPPWRTIAVVLAAAFLFALSTIPGSRQAAEAQSPPFAPCNTQAQMTAVAASAVLVAHVPGLQTYVCFYAFSLGLNATTTAQLVWGTGTTCGTTQTSASPVLALGTTVTGANPFIAAGGIPSGAITVNPSRGVSDLCIVVTGSTPAVNGVVWYVQA